MAWVRFSNGNLALFLGGLHQSSSSEVLLLGDPLLLSGQKIPILRILPMGPRVHCPDCFLRLPPQNLPRLLLRSYFVIHESLFHSLVGGVRV